MRLGSFADLAFRLQAARDHFTWAWNSGGIGQQSWDSAGRQEGRLRLSAILEDGRLGGGSPVFSVGLGLGRRCWMRVSPPTWHRRWALEARASASLRFLPSCSRQATI